jgi:LuxR family transcriptional regulator, positive regulator of biofilm formation
LLIEKLKEKGLSKREIEVCCEIIKGITAKQVGDMLFVTEKTIKFHLTNIHKKIGVRSRPELIVFCIPFLNEEQRSEKYLRVEEKKGPRIKDPLPTGI